MGSKPNRSSLASLIRDRVLATFRPQVEVTPIPDHAQVDWNVAIVVRDGTTLRANVFRPLGTDAVPVIVSMHPYGKDAFPAHTRSGKGLNLQYRIMPQPRPVRFSGWTGWEAPDPAVWVERGYAVLNVDGRGGGTSEGTGDLFSDQEAEDYYDVIEWAAAQPWSTGKIGLDGVSYLAISQYKVAALHPPHLAAICPWEGFTDFYRDFARPGGIREDGFSRIWLAATRKIARLKTDLRKEMVARDERDEFYQALTPRLEDIQVPMLVCASFSDHNLHTRGSFEAFRRVGSRQKWAYTHRDGKWSHYYSEGATDSRARFFDHFLKGVDNGWQKVPAVRLAIYESKEQPAAVVYEEAWPPNDLTWTDLSFDLDARTLSEEPTATREGSVSCSTRGEGLRLEWTIPRDMDVIGPMAVRVCIQSPELDELHLFAGVRKISGGAETTFEGSFGFNRDMVSTGWQRAAFRELDATLSTPHQPVHTFRDARPLAPSEKVPVDIEMRPHATRFRAGDILRLELRGSWHYPRDPVRGQFPSGYSRSKAGTFVVHSPGARLHLGWRALTDESSRHP